MYHTTYNIQHALQRLLQRCSCGGRVSYIKHTNILPDTTSRREREAREQMLRTYGTPGDRVTQLYTEPPGMGGFCPRTVAVITRA